LQLSTAAGRAVSEKEKFTPLARWSNKHTEPDFEVNLNYHTKDMLGFISEFLPSAASAVSLPVLAAPSTKRKRLNLTSDGHIDLTADDSEDDDDCIKEARLSDDIELVDDDISILPRKSREVPLLDLVDEDGSGRQWSSVKLLS
jgi:hypothetical protein